MTKIGEVNTEDHRRMYKDTYAEWKIDDFFTTVVEQGYYERYESPAFYVLDTPFFFQLYRRNRNHPEHMNLSLRSDVSREYSVEYNFGIKELDGAVECLSGGIMKGGHLSCHPGASVMYSELLRRKSELAPNDAFTFTCTVKPETVHSIETTGMTKSKGLKLKSLDRLSENFKNLFADKDTCDTTVKVKDKEYKVHRLILIARSSVFAAAFKHDTLERQTGLIIIPDCDPDSFQLFLDFLYSGQLEELSFRSALNLYYTSDKYDVQELKEFCVENLVQCLTVENICEIILFADKYNEERIFTVVQDFFNQNYSEISSTSEWNDLLRKERRLADKFLVDMPQVNIKQ